MVKSRFLHHDHSSEFGTGPPYSAQMRLSRDNRGFPYDYGYKFGIPGVPFVPHRRAGLQGQRGLKSGKLTSQIRASGGREASGREIELGAEDRTDHFRFLLFDPKALSKQGAFS